MTKIHFSWVYMKKWSFNIWAFFIFFIVTPVAYITYNIFSLYIQLDGMAFYVLEILVIEIGFFSIVTLLLGSNYQLYIHHYMIGLCSIPLVSYQKPLISLLNAFLVGMMIEGGSRWGYDPTWYPVG